jgi:hypothetical protein
MVKLAMVCTLNRELPSSKACSFQETQIQYIHSLKIRLEDIALVL